MKRKIYQLGAPLLAAVILAGCGGGGGGNGPYYPIATNPPPTTTPPPAANPYDDFLAYVKGLVATALDTAEPANVAAFDPPPTSETNEPISTD